MRKSHTVTHCPDQTIECTNIPPHIPQILPFSADRHLPPTTPADPLRKYASIKVKPDTRHYANDSLVQFGEWLEGKMGREDRYVVPLDAAVVGGGGGSLSKKPAGSRSWILMDSSGQETILEVDKYAIMHRVQIHARDLRILDPLLSYPSTILGRERAIVLNLEVSFV